MARFHFKALFGVATIRGQLDFEGGVYRDRYTHAYTTPIISLLYARIMRMHIRINVVDPLPCREISRATFVGMKHVARFQGQRDFEVRRDFEEIRYIDVIYNHHQTINNAELRNTLHRHNNNNNYTLNTRAGIKDAHSK